jgi:hypothetical protein
MEVHLSPCVRERVKNLLELDYGGPPVPLYEGLSKEYLSLSREVRLSPCMRDRVKNILELEYGGPPVPPV